MRLVTGLLIGFFLGWLMADRYPGGADEMVRQARDAVQAAMPWIR
jgi:hypothetical protein